MYNNKSCTLPFSLFPINFNCTMWNRWSFYFSCHCYYYLICLDIHANGNANTRTDAMKFPHVILNCPSHLISAHHKTHSVRFELDLPVRYMYIQNECGECRRLLSFQ